jgi:hypothetical protein
MRGSPNGGGKCESIKKILGRECWRREGVCMSRPVFEAVNM